MSKFQSINLPVLEDKKVETEIRKMGLDILKKLNEVYDAIPFVSQEYSYTPSNFQGFGTVTGINFKWRRVGDKMQIRGTFTSGTVSASEAQIGLPSPYQSTSELPTLQAVGSAARSSVGAETFTMLIEPSKIYLTIGVADGARSGLVKQNANALIGAGEQLSIFAEIPIAQWQGEGVHE